MTHEAAPPAHRRRRGVWIAVGVLGLTGISLVGLGLWGGERTLGGPAPSRVAVAAAVAGAPTQTALSTGRSVPRTLVIPAIGLSVPVGSLGLDSDGTVQVPTGTTKPGWFRLGPTPGQIGSAVILGHVDSHLGPGVFFKLRTLSSGDQVDVVLADGDTARFTVNSVAMYSKSGFPAQRVYGSHGSSALQLVTCGGVFDPRSGSYLSNIVVYTSLTGVLHPA